MKRGACLVFVLLCLGGRAGANTITVPVDYSLIQEAIAASSNGDTVTVQPGTYAENIDFLGKAITLRSEQGPEVTIIDGSEAGPVVTFQNAEGLGSILDGFTIRNGDTFYGGGISCRSFTSPTIRHNIITANLASFGAGIDLQTGCSPAIIGNTITGNSSSNFGGGISVWRSTPEIRNNTIRGNTAFHGAGIGVGANVSGTPPSIISRNIITDNISTDLGGGIYLVFTATPVLNNLIHNNSAATGGAGIWVAEESDVLVANTTITGNSSNQGIAGGIGATLATVTVVNTILWGNEAPTGPEFDLSMNSTLNISYSDVDGGQASVHTSPDSVSNWGAGMIDADPLFVTGPEGGRGKTTTTPNPGFFLSQVAAGQTADSPCVDTGSPASEMIAGTTRTDLVQDTGDLDMGYHYSGLVRLVTGPGPGYDNPPLVRLFPLERNGGAAPLEFPAYGASRYGVNVTCGDVDADLTDEILTGAGPGDIYGPHVRGFEYDGQSASPIAALSFLAYGTNRWGVNVVTGNIDDDPADEIITGAGPGAVFGPHVRAFDFDGSSVSPVPGVSYFAYGTPKWGVNVATGDLDGDGYDEIVTGPGPGSVYGPHVRGWNVDGGPATAMPGTSFLAYGTNKYGVRVSCGDVDGDGIDEIITAPGPGSVFGAHVRGFEANGTPLPGLSFFAWPPSDARYGAKVFAGAHIAGDERDEIVVGQGPDANAGTWIKVYLYDGQVTEWLSLEAYDDLGLTHGANVAAGRF